jgi:hypothetical protein
MKRREGENNNNPTDSSDEIRVGTARPHRIQRDLFDAFSAKLSRRKWRRGKETSEKSKRKKERAERNSHIATTIRPIPIKRPGFEPQGRAASIKPNTIQIHSIHGVEKRGELDNQPPNSNKKTRVPTARTRRVDRATLRTV